MWKARADHANHRVHRPQPTTLRTPLPGFSCRNQKEKEGKGGDSEGQNSPHAASLFRSPSPSDEQHSTDGDRLMDEVRKHPNIQAECRVLRCKDDRTSTRSCPTFTVPVVGLAVHIHGMDHRDRPSSLQGEAPGSHTTTAHGPPARPAPQIRRRRRRRHRPLKKQQRKKSGIGKDDREARRNTM